MKNKTFFYAVTINFGNSIDAETKEEAEAILKENFLRDFNITLNDDEIEYVGESSI